MNIAILGTKGIPNNYGGFEQFAEYLSVGLVKKGHEVTVYNPHYHPYKEHEFKGVKIRPIYSPEKWIGGAANFIYDYLCLKDALKRNFDIIYEAGYHSNAPSYYLMNNKQSPLLITNMDGLEWKRSKWSKATQRLIKYLEKIAVKKSHYLISDNIGIQQYYQDKFGVETFYLPYGAEIIQNDEPQIIQKYGLHPYRYYLLIARLEPENNIETVLGGYVLNSRKDIPFIVIGNHNTKYGNYLKKRYSLCKGIQFIGSLYQRNDLDQLRHFALGYFHGHSVGGTNPSLLEAMGSKALIIAHDNIFNKSILANDALYFKTSQEVSLRMNELQNLEDFKREVIVKSNLEKIRTIYNWNNIIDKHIVLFNSLLEKK